MLFVNPEGVLCKTFKFYDWSITLIDVSPECDGYDVGGNLINDEDFSWKSDDVNYERQK